MVGDPKTLYDLRKIDADLRVVCRSCGRRRMLDREWLIGELLRRKKSVDWSLVRHQFRCAADGCGSRDAKLEIVPFAGRDVPPPVQALIDAVMAYVEAHAAMRGQDLMSLQRAAAAQGEMHRATRRLVMWAKYGDRG